MARQNYLFTSESVSEGHPDKVCDRISDEVVDLFFREGPKSGLSPWDIRAACETMATTNRVIIAGETRGPEAYRRRTDRRSRAQRDQSDIGYEQEGFHWKTANVEVLLHAQSPHIAQGVDASGNKDEGAGDQGIMFGYACRETPALMPAPLFYSHKILKLLADARHAGKEPKLGPDAKSQVTVQYENGKPVGATQIVLSTQHLDADMTSNDVRASSNPISARRCRPAGSPTRPSGTSIRPAPSSSADRTATAASPDARSSSTPMAARPRMAAARSPARIRPRSIARPPMPRAISPRTSWLRGLADRCTIQIAYAIGVSEPLSFYVDTHGTGKVDEAKLEKILPELMSLKPRDIREHLGLNKPIYARTSAYGHFGREPDADGGFSWEKTDLADALKRAF